MARINHWIEIVCEYKGCRWHSDLLTPAETKACWRQYREHKRKDHPEKCNGCKFIDNKIACITEGCTKGRKK